MAIVGAPPPNLSGGITFRPIISPSPKSSPLPADFAALKGLQGLRSFDFSVSS